jgi:polyisoprenoid-binding protein YceI
MFRTLALSFLALSFLSVPSFAAASLSQDAATQPAGIYVVDTKHVSVHWKISHLGLSNYTARFDKIDGELNFDPKDPSKSTVRITIDPKSVNTGLPDFDKKLAGEGYFDSAKNPSITFTSTSIEKTSDTTGKITGDLSLNGVTKPVTLDTVFNGGAFNQYAGGHALGFSAKTKIKRSDFGMTTLLPAVGDDVEILIEIEFLQKPTEAKE